MATFSGATQLASPHSHEYANRFSHTTPRALQKPFSILVILKNRPPLIPMRHDMVPRPGIFDAQWSGHLPWAQFLGAWKEQKAIIIGPTLFSKSDNYRTDPIFVLTPFYPLVAPRAKRNLLPFLTLATG